MFIMNNNQFILYVLFLKLFLCVHLYAFSAKLTLAIEIQRIDLIHLVQGLDRAAYQM